MAFKLPDTKGFIDVALRIDDALDMTNEQYELYLKNPTPDNLVVKPGCTPTLIRMRKVLPWKQARAIEDMKMGMVTVKDGDKVKQEMVPKIAWMYEEVRCAIVDIINPPDAADPVPFSKDAESGASHELASQLLGLGVMVDLYNAREAAISGGNSKLLDADKKK